MATAAVVGKKLHTSNNIVVSDLFLLASYEYFIVFDWTLTFRGPYPVPCSTNRKKIDVISNCLRCFNLRSNGCRIQHNTESILY